MDLRFQRILRPIAAVTLFFFSWISIEPWNYAAWAQTSPKPKTSASQPSKTTSGKFEESLRATKKAVEDLDQDVASGKDITLELESLKGHKQIIEAADPEIRAEFKATEKFLKEKKLPAEILARHAKAVADYDTNYKTLKTNLDSIIQSETDRKKAESQNDRSLAQSKRNELKATIKAAKDHLAVKVKEPRHQKLDPNNLPHRTAKPTNKKPRLKKEEFKNLVGENDRSPVLLAYNGDPTGLLLAQNTQDLPTPADLAETIEVQFTPDIQAKAAELEHNPVKIYNWVHNNIDFVPTYGSIQGAQMCLLTKQCNDMDTASLLIALLRTSGIAARYVTGTIQIPMDQVMNWVGGFTDPQSAINFISSGGTPVTGLVSGGKFITAQMEHTWVEAYVDYIPSRGAVHKQGDTWVPMDGSFKQFTYTSGVDLQTAVPFDAQAFINQLQSTATINESAGYVANIDSAYIQTTVTDLQTQLQSYLSTNLPNATVDNLIGKKTIQVKSSPFLLGTLPYKTVVAGSKVSSLDDSVRHKITFEITTEDFLGPDFSFTASLPELVSHRVTLSYVPATAADQQTVDQYGGLYNTPAYLVQIKPQIKVEGIVKAEGQAVALGLDQSFTMNFSLPNAGSDLVQNTITAGGYYAVGIAPGNLPSDFSVELSRRGQILKSYVESGASLISDKGVGEQFFLASLAYFYELSHFERIVGKGMNIVSLKQPSENIFGFSISKLFLFGIPTSVHVTGVYIDVDRDVNVVASKLNTVQSEKGFQVFTGGIGSFLENSIIEQLFGYNAISTVKAFALANSLGMRTFTITRNNVADIMPQLMLADEVKRDITDAVSTGKEVIVPEHDVQLDNWAGVGYAVIDVNTGSGAYIISGGSAGGDQTEIKNDLEIVAKALALVFSVLALSATLEVFEGLVLAIPWVLASFSGIALFLSLTLLLFNAAIVLIAAYLILEYAIIPLNSELKGH